MGFSPKSFSRLGSYKLLDLDKEAEYRFVEKLCNRIPSELTRLLPSSELLNCELQRSMHDAALAMHDAAVQCGHLPSAQGGLITIKSQVLCG